MMRHWLTALCLGCLGVCLAGCRDDADERRSSSTGADSSRAPNEVQVAQGPVGELGAIRGYRIS
jgi:hypothetical protein